MTVTTTTATGTATTPATDRPSPAGSPARQTARQAARPASTARRAGLTEQAAVTAIEAACRTRGLAALWVQDDGNVGASAAMRGHVVWEAPHAA